MDLGGGGIDRRLKLKCNSLSHKHSQTKKATNKAGMLRRCLRACGVSDIYQIINYNFYLDTYAYMTTPEPTRPEQAQFTTQAPFEGSVVSGF